MRGKLTLCALTLLFVLAGAREARSQTDADERRFEVGGHVTALGFDRFEADIATDIICINPPCLILPPRRETQLEAGFGGRAGYNFNRYVGLEAEVNFFPADEELTGGRKLQGLFGVKAGRRFERVGIFAKARPGFIHETRGRIRAGQIPCILIVPTPAGCRDGEGRTSFALDVGGIVELRTSGRTFLRFDAGDTIVRQDERLVVVEPNPSQGLSTGRRGLALMPAETTHNFQGSLGFGLRF